MKPSVVLDLHDLSERFVLWERTVNTFEVLLVVLKNLEETLHADFFPPTVLLEDEEAASQDVSNVRATANIAGQATVRNRNKQGSSVVKHNVNFLHLLD